jgi:glutamate carboxypeptidase
VNDPIAQCLDMSADDATERVLRRLRPWVETETPSGNVAAITALSHRIEQELDAIGGVVEAFDVPRFGRNLRVTFHGDHPELEHLLVLAHIDTVHPVGTLEHQPWRVLNDRAEGPGIFDMKGPLAVTAEALACLARRNRRPRRTVRFLITCDEEIGSHGSRDLIAECAAEAGVALVPEPSLPDGSAKTRRKGVGTYRLETHGRAGHAGIDPEQAVSATAELAHQVLTCLALADSAMGTTLNIGTIGGGTASNVVAAHAWATIDTRFVEPAEGERIDRALAALTPRLAGASVRVTRSELRPPLVRTPEVVRLYEQARQVAAGLGVALGEGATGGGSDGSLVAALGVPTLDGLGPRGGGAHAANEHILLSDLPFRVAFMLRLLETC